MVFEYFSQMKYCVQIYWSQKLQLTAHCLWGFISIPLDINLLFLYSVIVSHSEWLDIGLGLVNKFIWLLRLATISNSSTVVNSHSLQFTTACAKSSRSACLHQLSSGNTPNSHVFLIFHYPWLLSLLAGGYLTSWLGIAWSQSSNKGCSSCSCSSRNVLANHLFKASQITITPRLVFPFVVYLFSLPYPLFITTAHPSKQFFFNFLRLAK
jgi:hypothetical protein